MNKKYIPSALILYLNYFIHGVGCSILGQAVIKEALAASWGVEVMAITAISAALGLGRLIALPFAGPLSDKLGRRISTAIGSGSYAIYLIGLALAFNAGTGSHPCCQRHAHAERNFHRGQTGYRKKPSADCLQARCSCAGDLAELSGWSAPCGGHSYLAGIHRLLPDSFQQGAAHDGD